MVALHRRVLGSRNPIRTVGVVACMVVAAAVLPACSSEDSAEPAATEVAEMASSTTADSGQLVGTWNISNQTYTWGSDGTYSAEFDFGTYAFDGSVLTINSDPELVNECAGTTAQYAVTFVDADTVTMDVIDDPCQMREGGWMGELTWTRVTE